MGRSGAIGQYFAPPPPARYLNRNIDIGSMAQISVLWRSEKEGSRNQPEPSRKKSVWSACTARTASSHSHSQYSPQYTLTTRPGPQAISSPTSTYSRGGGGSTACSVRAAPTWRLESTFESESIPERIFVLNCQSLISHIKSGFVRVSVCLSYKL